MAAAQQKEYELLFKLKAALGNNFNSTFKNAITTTKQLQGTLEKVNKSQGQIDGYKKQESALQSNKTKLEKLNTEYGKLKQEAEAAGKPTKELARKLESTERQIQKTTTKIGEQENKLESLGKELRSAGISTNNLEKENQKLQKSYDAVRKSQEDLGKINAAQQKNMEAVAKTRSELRGTVGAIAAIGTAIYVGPARSAMAFETAMSDVSKVVDGLKDGTTGKLTKEYYLLKKEILDLSTKIPMTAKELTEIAAAAGQAGIAREEITKFSTDAAKMGIAFDATAEQAGEWLAKWRTSFGLSQDQVVELADKINYLGNTSAANAQQISEIVTKVGPLGEVAGFANGEIAALGATLVAVGVSEDVAATGIKKVMTTMTAGSAATKRQVMVLDRLGLSATGLAERMQKDAKGALLDFMKAINKLPEAEKAAALKNYFGEESVGAIAPMLTQLRLLEEQFVKVGDASLYAGSMQGEYAARAGTTENKVQLAKNSIAKLSVILGETFLPYIGEAAEKLSELVTKFADFAEKNPELIRTVLKVVTALLAFKAAMVVTKLGFLEMKGGILAAQKVFALFKGKAAAAAVESVALKGKLTAVGAGVKNYFGAVGGAMGNLINSSSILTKATATGKGVGSKIASGVLGSFGKLTAGTGKALSKVGAVIHKSPLGKIGDIISGGVMKARGAFAPLGNVISTAFAPLGKLGGSLLGGFGGVLGKMVPIVGVITLIIAGIQLVKNNLESIRGFVQKVFGDAGLAVFDKVVSAIANIGEVIKGVFSEGNLENARNFIQNIFGEQGVAVFDGLITLGKSLVTVFQGFWSFVETNITPMLQNLFNFIVNEILPVIAAKFAEWAPMIANIIEGVWSVISVVAEKIMGIINFLMPTIQSVIAGTVNAIMGVLGGAIQFFQGFINFLSGVFIGDLNGALEGIKQMFKGWGDALIAIVKAPINFLIDGINLLIRGINKVKIPDWVPDWAGRGKGINIPEIPGFKNGTPRTPDTFVAGEAGAELITNAKNRTVFKAAETASIFKNIGSLVSMANLASAPRLQMATPMGAVAVDVPELRAGTTNSQTIKIEVHNSPTIKVDGDKPDDLENKLKKNNQDLLDQIDERVDERMRRKEDDERRSRYE